MLRADLCDFSDACIAVEGTVTVTAPNNARRNKPSNPLSSDSESFRCKTSITGNAYNLGGGDDDYDANKVGKNETEIVVPFKHLSNIWRTFDMPLINCEIKPILTCSKSCTLAV